MVDMCLCSGVGCNRADNCLRARAVGCEYRQSYFVGLPNNEDGTCNYYADVKDFENRYVLKPAGATENETE